MPIWPDWRKKKEWGELEGKLKLLRAKAGQAAEVAVDAAEDVAAAARLLGEEIARGYERLRRLFSAAAIGGELNQPPALSSTTSLSGGALPSLARPG